MIKQFSTLAIAGVVTTIATFAANPAKAVTVTLNQTIYDISTVTGSFNDLESQLTSTPWFGNQTLSQQLALEVGDSFGTPNFGFFGPYFSYDNNNNLSTFFGSTGGTINGLVRKADTRVYATVTAEPVPEPLTIFGTVAALAFGVKFKQKVSKSA